MQIEIIETWLMGPVPKYRVNSHKDIRDIRLQIPDRGHQTTVNKQHTPDMRQQSTGSDCSGGREKHLLCVVPFVIHRILFRANIWTPTPTVVSVEFPPPPCKENM
jgi:hypothetical protein